VPVGEWRAKAARLRGGSMGEQNRIGEIQVPGGGCEVVGEVTRFGPMAAQIKVQFHVTNFFVRMAQPDAIISKAITKASINVV